jgi:DNA-binding SARP family transcriptional activator
MQAAGRPIELRATTFGGFHVEIDGRAVDTRDWKAASARWIFLYLILHEGEEIGQARLRELFWPASPPEQGHRALLTSIYRARRALGYAEAIERTEQSYRLGRRCKLWLDLREFLECHALWRTEEGGLEHLIRMENLYRGPFVPECSDVWCAKLRLEIEQLRSQLQRKC